MVERRPALDFITHIVLLLGVAVVAFPVYLTFVASTHTAREISQAPMPLWPGSQLVHNYLAALTGSQRLIIEAGLSGTRVALRLAGIGWHLAGAAHIPDGRGAVFCVNHASYLDLVAFVALYPVCPGLRVIYKSEFGRVPILGRVFSMAGAIPVQRAHPVLQRR